MIMIQRVGLEDVLTPPQSPKRDKRRKETNISAFLLLHPLPFLPPSASSFSSLSPSRAAGPRTHPPQGNK